MEKNSKIPRAIYEVKFEKDTLIFDFTRDVKVYLKTSFRYPVQGPTITIQVDENEFFRAVDKKIFAPIISVMLSSKIEGGFSGYLMTWAILNQFIKPKIFDTYDQKVAKASYENFLEKVEL